MGNSLSKEIVCIVCPVGCKLTVEETGKGYNISGHQCKRGEDYAIEELTHPTRMLTTTVKVRNSRHVRLAVHSSTALPKDLLFQAMAVINTCCVQPPIKIGQAVIKDILNTGVDICASRDIGKE